MHIIIINKQIHGHKKSNFESSGAFSYSPHFQKCSVAVFGSKIYCTGFQGYDPEYANFLAIYNTENNTWTLGSHNPHSTSVGTGGGTFFTIGNYMFYQGGCAAEDDEYDGFVTTKVPSIYLPTVDEWYILEDDIDISNGDSWWKFANFCVYENKLYFNSQNYNRRDLDGTGDEFEQRLMITAMPLRYNPYSTLGDNIEEQTMSIGSSHSMKIENGKLYVKGDNTYGQLGTGDNDKRDEYTLVSGPWGDKIIKKVETRTNTSYVLTEDGNLYGWGKNNKYQVGDETTVDRNYPVLIMSGVCDIKAGVEHAVALKYYDQVYAWGDNSFHQVNYTDNSFVASPNLIISGYSCYYIGAGDYQTYYMGSDSELNARGKNDKGQLGTGYTGYFLDVEKVEGGSNHTVAILNDGAVYVWGDNTYGQLGSAVSEGTTYTDTPAFLCYANNAYARGNKTVYLLDGKVYQTGQEFNGNSNIIKKVENLENVAKVTLGEKYGIAKDENDIMWRWGAMTDNAAFSLTEANSSTPLKIEYPFAIKQIDSYRNQSLAIDELGQVLAWGEGYFADGTDKSKTEPYPTKISGIDNPIHVSRGKNHNLVLDKNGNVWGWGSNSNYPMGNNLGGKVKIATKLSCISNVQQVAAGTEFSIFLKNDGTLWGVGKNDNGQLGQGTTSNSNVPVQITTKTDFKKISVGEDYVAAVASDGLYLWGKNAKFQLGDGTNVNNPTPTKVDVTLGENEHFIDISAGIDFCLALTNLGNVYAWGDNGSGELGQNGVHKTPSKITTLNDIKKISASKKSGFAIKSDGTVYSWGYGYDGQLGYFGNSEYVPKVITALQGVEISSIACGYSFTTALSKNGDIYSFGNNVFGQLGVYTSTVLMCNEDRTTTQETVEGNTSGQAITCEITINAGQEHVVEYIAKKAAVYEFSTSGSSANNVIAIAYKDSEMKVPYTQTTGQNKITVGAQANSTVYIKYINQGNTAFSANMSIQSISNVESDGQKVHIVLYDSGYAERESEAGGVPRYFDESGNKYKYDKEFFTNYLQLIKGKDAYFSISIRDLDFDREIDPNRNLYEEPIMLDYTNLNMNGRLWYVETISIEKVVKIYECMKQAYTDLPIDSKPIEIPKIYIGSPHYSGWQPKTADETDEYIVKYANITESIYEGVENWIGSEAIAGIYYGKEDPNDLTLEENQIYWKIMRNTAMYVHGKNKKLIWMPYTAGQYTNFQNISKTVNNGRYQDYSGSYQDMCDEVVLQPGLFFYEVSTSAEVNGNKVEITEDNYVDNMNYILESCQNQRMQVNGVAEDGGKSTNTQISFQIECDGSLYTGREKDEKTYPIKKAERLVKTIRCFKELMYVSKMYDGNRYPFGLYIGSPSEQDFSNLSENGNINLHSNRNHITAYEAGHGLAYKDFYDRIKAEHYVTSYNGLIIYEITKGLLYNSWSVKTKETLDSFVDENGNNFLNFSKISNDEYSII